MTDKTTTGSDVVDLDKSRAQFEAWALNASGKFAWLRFIDGRYINPEAQTLWEGWQAAMIAQARAAAPVLPQAAHSFLMSQDLYQFLTNAQNGIDSPATCSSANRLLVWLDKVRDALAALSQQPVQAVEDDLPPLPEADLWLDPVEYFTAHQMRNYARAALAAQAAPVIGASTAPSDEQIEAAAKAIYERFLGSEAHPWVERGNSNKQDDARYYARAALKAASLGAPTATGEPVATIDTPEFQELLAEWSNADVDAADAYSCVQYRRIVEHISAKIAAPAPQQAAPLTDAPSVKVKKLRDLVRIQCADGTWDVDEYMRGMANGLLVALSVFDETEPTFKPSAPKSPGDDAAVARFAEAMQAKMAKSRAKGRRGWEDVTQCPAESLQSMLLDHLAKGDPVDVANFCMMLWNRGEPVSAGSTASAGDARDAALEEAAAAIEHDGDWCGGHGMPRAPSPAECAEKIRKLKGKPGEKQ